MEQEIDLTDAIWCTYCGAAPEVPCMTKKGTRAARPHECRIAWHDFEEEST